LEDLGLSGALRWMVDDFSTLHNIKFALTTEEINHLFSQESQIIIYRIFQEALNNVGKHAHARHVSVTTDKLKDNVCFIVEDDGIGFDVDQPLIKNPNEKSLGLAAMDERARMLGASFNIQSKIGQGTRITLTVPVDVASEEQKIETLSYRASR
jgi:signal transduction histidine kinase